MTSQNQSDQALLKQFSAAFLNAETTIKRAEQFATFSKEDTGDVDDVCGPLIPAINELRCAGFHISRYLEKKDTLDIQKAISHCQRAEYDAYDCQIQFFMSECRQFQIDYKNIVISSVVPDYINIIQKLNDLSQNPTTRD